MAQSIPLADLQAQYQVIGEEIDAAIRRVISKSSFILGPEVANFEQAFAAYCGAEHCAGVSSGTAALELALRAMGVGTGDEVITVAHTFIATAEAISVVGATPVFVDVDPHSYNLAPEAFAEAINARTRAVMPVHLYGQPADMTRINRIAREHGIRVIEAQRRLTAQRGRATRGVLGDAACFSFYPERTWAPTATPARCDQSGGDRRAGAAAAATRARRAKYLHEQIGFGERLDVAGRDSGNKLPPLGRLDRGA